MFSGLVMCCSDIKRYSVLARLNEPGLAHWEGSCREWVRVALRSATGASSEVYFQLCC